MMTNQNISQREKEVLHLLAYENSSKEIAKELFISEHTVFSHRKNLLSKMQVKNTAGLVRKGFELGLLSLSRNVAFVLLLILGSICSTIAQNEVELRSDGIVVPRTTTSAVSSPIEGMLIYDTSTDGFKYYNGSTWQSIGSGTGGGSSTNSFDSIYVAHVAQIGNENISYKLDTAGMIVKREADTILTIDNNLQTNMNFKFTNSDTSGSVLIRTVENPEIRLFDDEGNLGVRIQSHAVGASTPERNPRIILTHNDENGDEVSSISLIGNYDHSNDSRIITDEIQIDGGSDLAELFDITNNESLVQPGLIVSLDPNQPGKLMLSDKAYDRKVAGVLSGANGVKPGILMGQSETIATGDDLVTLSGRTYVMANTSRGEIKVGDLITTSDIEGEAMKAKNKRKAQGAIIGKAMTGLKNGKGYVLVLVNLQ